jgi:hypothetical protein
MLPDSTVPGSLAYLLAVFRPCFTAPTFRAFTGLIVGLIASTRLWVPEPMQTAR